MTDCLGTRFTHLTVLVGVAFDQAIAIPLVKAIVGLGKGKFFRGEKP